MNELKIISELQYILLPLKGHNMELLEKKIVMLKQNDAEGWAVGEMLQRALDYCNSHNSKEKEDENGE